MLLFGSVILCPAIGLVIIFLKAEHEVLNNLTSIHTPSTSRNCIIRASNPELQMDYVVK